MKAILISIYKKWNNLIFETKEKTIEIRKNLPKPPFRAIVYEPEFGGGCGGVIGEFICNSVSSYDYIDGLDGYPYYLITKTDFEKTCIKSPAELRDYGNGKTLYGAHITDVILYDKPKSLLWFRKPPCWKYMTADCLLCNHAKLQKDSNGNTAIECRNYIRRPPQSWQYVQNA